MPGDKTEALAEQVRQLEQRLPLKGGAEGARLVRRAGRRYGASWEAIYAADAEVSDAYAITLIPGPSSYAAGQEFIFKANTANTGGATLNVNALGAKTILKQNDQALATGDIEAGQIVTVVYDGTNFQMQSQVASAAAGGGAVATDVIWDAKGDLAVGTGVDTAVKLTVGADNAVLQALASAATGLIWRTIPWLDAIADTGGTTRLDLGIASPHVALTGDLDVSGFIAVGNAGSVLASTVIRDAHDFSLGSFGVGLGIGMAIRDIGSVNAGTTAVSVIGVDGRAANERSGTKALALVAGLQFIVEYNPSVASPTTDLKAIKTQTLVAATVGSVTNMAGWENSIDSGASAVGPTNVYGIQNKLTWSGLAPTNFYWIDMPAVTVGTNRYGIRMGSVAGGTIARLLELGAGPTMRLLDRGTGGWTAAANETPLWIEQGATPTLRQMKTRVWDATAGHGFTNGDLVCYF